MGKSIEDRRGLPGTEVEFGKWGVYVRQPDPDRCFSPAQATAFAQAIQHAADEARAEGCPDFHDE